MRDKEVLLEITLKNHEVELLKKIVETQEQEREKIAKDIHDDVGPRLTILKLHQLAYLKTIEDKKNETIKKTIQEIDEVISELRSISQDLSPSHVINFGLAKALSHVVNQISESTDIKSEFHSSISEEEYFAKHLSINVYRLFTELINNLLKHAFPKHIEVEIQTQSNLLNLSIKHDGNGLSHDEFLLLTENSEGIGIKSIKSRVILLNGKIHFNKNIKFSEIQLSIPI